MSLRDELQRPHVRALLIGGGVILLLAIALYFVTKKKTSALDASNRNGLNADASGQVPTVLVLPPPIIFGPPSNEAPTVQPPLPVQSPPLPAPPLPLGILQYQPPAPPVGPSPPVNPAPTGPLGILAH